MKLYDLDLTNYLYNPTDNKALRRLINRFEEFQQDAGINISKIIVYIILMYDLNSELRRIYADYFTRKREAAIMAGFNINRHGRFSESIEEMLLGENDKVNDMIVRYAMLFNNPDYISLVAYTEMLIKETKISLGKEYNKDTINNITKLNKEIKILMINIFGGSPHRNLIKALYRTMEREKLRYRPELIAKDIVDKKLDLPINIYPDE